MVAITRKINSAIATLHSQGFAYTLGYATHLVRLRLMRKQVAGDKYARLGEARMLLHSSMKGLSETVFLYSVHEPENTRLYSQLIHPGDTVLDIGGNIGYYALIASQLVGPTGRVIAVEPVPDTYCYLHKNTAVCPNITSLQVAVGVEGATQELHISEVPNWSALFRYPGQKVINTISVVTRSIDALVDELGIAPNVVRMDIEGGEVEALAGAMKTIFQHKPRICVELHPTILGVRRVKDIVSGLMSSGYVDGICMDRIYDEPFMPSVVRALHVKRFKLSELIVNADRLLNRTTHLIVQHPDNA